MADLNDTELRGHITRLSNRARASSPSQRTLEDLEDYYERALQIRQLQNGTLQEQLAEVNAQRSSSDGRVVQLYHACMWLIAGWAAFSVLLARTVWPQQVQYVLALLGTAVAYPPVLVMITASVTWVGLHS